MKKTYCVLIALAAMLAGSVLAENAIVNGDFATGELKPWTLSDKKAPAEPVIEEGVLHLIITEAGEMEFHRQLIQKNLSLESGTKYILSFEMKASEKGDIKASIVPSINYKNPHYGLMKKERVDVEWSTIEFKFKTKDIAEDDPACIKLQLGSFSADVWLKNFTLTKAE